MARLSLDAVKTELALERWVLVSEEYVNLDTELTMLCPEGHKVFLPLKQWRRKKECPTCEANIYRAVENVVSAPKKKGVVRTLALDNSTTITGWAVFDGRELVGRGKVSMTQKDAMARITGLKEWLMSMIARWNPDNIAIEDIQKQDNVKIFKTLAHLQGVLLNVFYEQKINYEVVHSASWRSYCGIKGRNRTDLKRAAQKYVKDKYDISVTQDEADAICLGHYAIESVLKNNEFSKW